jgi:hypothetical protein
VWEFVDDEESEDVDSRGGMRKRLYLGREGREKERANEGGTRLVVRVLVLVLQAQRSSIIAYVTISSIHVHVSTAAEVIWN